MSGIAGIIHFDGQPVEPGQMQAMTAAMHYRGPDSITHWCKGHVALGHCMLRTTAESLEEAQPLVNEDESLVLTMDGCINNWEELRRELLGRGAKLRTRADAELVLRAYEVWGQDCLAHLDGDFAFVIWDARRQLAFCARDRLGNKPFHFHWSGNSLIFSSDLHPILTLPWVEQRPNPGVLAEFLAAQWYSRDETLWRGVTRLVAAHSMTVTRDGTKSICYWSPNVSEQLPYKTDEDYIEAYRDLFFDCVRRASRSHHPVAIEVSGGLDSSAVLCVAEKLQKAHCLPAHAIHAYTLAFTEPGATNEVAYARLAAEFAGVALTEVAPTLPSLEWFAQKAARERYFPGFPNMAMFPGIRQRALADGCRVTLTGEGGDQWLDGSRLYYAEALAQRDWRTLGDSLRRDAKLTSASQAMKWFARYGIFPFLSPAAQRAVRAVVRAAVGQGRASRASELFWLTPRVQHDLQAQNDAYQALRLQRKPVRDFGQAALFDCLIDPFTDMVMERAGLLAAQHGGETRYPMRDHRFVQFAFATPERLRLRGLRTKFIHTQALQGILPDSIRERTTKADFDAVIRRPLDQVELALTHTLPHHHPELLSAQGMKALFEIYRTNPAASWPLWILWSAYTCLGVIV